MSLAGKTVMPTIVDTHVHTSQTREALTQDLTRRAYYGVSAAMSLGQDTGGALRDQGDADSGCGAHLQRRTRNDRARAWPDDGAVLDHDGG